MFMLIMSFLYNFESLRNEQKRYLLFLITILQQMLFVIGGYNMIYMCVAET